ncbi:enoyl-CoA hydratase-related protein, partial [Actinophytocola sp.]|uniref:enoyl-CoA hydratase-related protein n=1 Tax=Actinophytocola sp. TaxID=1872138 RepID=UPI002D5DDE14
MGEFVRLEVDSGVGTIRLDRPPMNALNRQVQEEIRAAAQEAARRDDVRAVIVYGGEKVFAAGADIKEMAELSYVDMAARAGELSSSFTAVAEIPKP